MKYSLAIIAIILSGLSLRAQHVSFNLQALPGFWHNEALENYYGGSAFGIQYHQKSKIGQWGLGIEYRSIDWGNQISLNIPYTVYLAKKNNWDVALQCAPSIGLALFRNNPLLSWSLESSAQLRWKPQNKFSYTLGVGLRYSISPAYQQYGLINQLAETPIRLGIQYKIGKTKN